MKAVELRKLDQSQLVEKLDELRQEELKANMQKASGQVKSHQFKHIRRDIARVKTLLTEMKGSE